jgi:hypothetical protein
VVFVFRQKKEEAASKYKTLRLTSEVSSFKTALNYLFLCLFFRSFFLRLWVAIFRSLRFLPQGIASPFPEFGYQSMKESMNKVK